MSHYLITGGCGFIGSNLAEAMLAAGHKIRVLDDLSTGKHENLPPNTELLVASITDADAVDKAMRGVDACIHLAAIASVQRSTEQWAGASQVNLTGTINIFQAARQAPNGPLPVVYASSAAVYGTASAPIITEDLPKRPTSAYGVDKLGCELHASIGGGLFGLPTFGLRFFNVYGPRQDPSSPYSGVISIFMDRISTGAAITINGDGEQIRDFIYVGDVVSAIQSALTAASPQAPVANLCTGEPTTINDLLALIGQCFDRVPEATFGAPRAGDIQRSLGDNALAKKLLNWKPKVSLREGLEAYRQSG
ncbi:MAG: NAD-dependent epimerase/dehydratase family protein [Alphaproteobacteria bacterium]